MARALPRRSTVRAPPSGAEPHRHRRARDDPPARRRGGLERGHDLLDALVNDRPAVCVLVDEGAPVGEAWAAKSLIGEHYLDVAASGAFHEARSFEEVVAGIERCLGAPDELAAQRRAVTAKVVDRRTARSGSSTRSSAASSEPSAPRCDVLGTKRRPRGQRDRARPARAGRSRYGRSTIHIRRSPTSRAVRPGLRLANLNQLIAELEGFAGSCSATTTSSSSGAMSSVGGRVRSGGLRLAQPAHAPDLMSAIPIPA